MNAPFLGTLLSRRYAHGTRVPAVAVAACVFVALVPRAAVGQMASDSVAVGTLAEGYRSTWGKHDPTALSRFFTKDADMIMGTDPVSVGREAIDEWWGTYFERQEPERQVEIVIDAVRFITRDVAVLNVTTTTGGHGSQGEALQSRRARGTWVVVRQAGAWQISAMRGMPTEEDQIIRGSAIPKHSPQEAHLGAIQRRWASINDASLSPDGQIAFYLRGNRGGEVPSGRRVVRE